MFCKGVGYDILVEGYYDERTQQYAGPTIKKYFGIKEQ
jgi:hypothetical protein